MNFNVPMCSRARLNRDGGGAPAAPRFQAKTHLGFSEDTGGPSVAFLHRSLCLGSARHLRLSTHSQVAPTRTHTLSPARQVGFLPPTGLPVTNTTAEMAPGTVTHSHLLRQHHLASASRSSAWWTAINRPVATTRPPVPSPPLRLKYIAYFCRSLISNLSLYRIFIIKQKKNHFLPP